MVDYTKTMGRESTTTSNREFDLKPINREMDDERLMIKDYTHDQVVEARGLGFDPSFDLARERARMAEIQKQMNPEVIEGGGDVYDPELDMLQDVENISLQIDLLMEEEEREREEKEVAKKVADLEYVAIEIKQRPVSVQTRAIPTIDVNAFKKEIKKEHPSVDLDKVVDQMDTRSKKPTLQERLREIQESQEKHAKELERFEKDNELSL